MDPILLFISILLVVVLTILLSSAFKKNEPLANIYLRDLTYLGQEESLDRVVGSLSRVDDLLHGLAQQRHVLLLADSLRSREEIVSSLVRSLASSKHPILKGHKLLAVDVHDLAFGTRNSKSLQTKFKSIVKQLSHDKRPVILYIDDIHELILTDSKDKSGLNLLLPLLQENKIKIIGATNYGSYNQELQELEITSEFMVLPLESTNKHV